MSKRGAFFDDIRWYRFNTRPCIAGRRYLLLSLIMHFDLAENFSRPIPNIFKVRSRKVTCTPGNAQTAERHPPQASHDKSVSAEVSRYLFAAKLFRPAYLQQIAASLPIRVWPFGISGVFLSNPLAEVFL